MKKTLYLLLLISQVTLAGSKLDLDDPENAGIAKYYPGYEAMVYSNFTEGVDASVVALWKDKNQVKWDKMYIAKIEIGTSGQQKIFILLTDSCSNDKNSYAPVVIKTNHQNVRYYKDCILNNIILTPVSSVGVDFVVNEFKKDGIVIFDFLDFNIVFDATGFTKAWAEFGGDAL